MRAGIDYYPHPQVRITAGYCFVETYPYGEYPVANAFPEHRIWQTILLTQPLGRLTVQHRLRPEQRFLGNAATGRFENGRYENRFRYMFRVVWPLQGKTMEHHEFYAAFQDEIFINFGKQVSYNVFDQNRIYGAIGFNLGSPGRIEAGYMHQLVQQRNLQPDRQLVFENNHTLVIAYFCNINLYKDKQ
ncbi:DUF2490 domain-containing protein [Rhodocytophaga aerolata]|uniref:DUF2490 domain-containing protein n=1 Tax=Rhodocytophaga aerolata TaxID=455078 RepID=A0ABT8RCQ2_9BACT|nr:DUF2490 domain-containing protein [Rhodocytophaga aerolata]MDO1449879.1 DUF2490 domain-containing protein [Rhodocytophaga aerolata]